MKENKEKTGRRRASVESGQKQKHKHFMGTLRSMGQISR